MAKSYPKWAALLTAMPVVTLLSLIWIYIENRDLKLLETYTYDVLLWLIPSIFFLIAAYWLFRLHVPFILSMASSILCLGVAVLIFQKLKLLK